MNVVLLMMEVAWQWAYTTLDLCLVGRQRTNQIANYTTLNGHPRRLGTPPSPQHMVIPSSISGMSLYHSLPTYIIHKISINTKHNKLSFAKTRHTALKQSSKC